MEKKNSNMSDEEKEDFITQIRLDFEFSSTIGEYGVDWYQVFVNDDHTLVSIKKPNWSPEEDYEPFTYVKLTRSSECIQELTGPEFTCALLDMEPEPEVFILKDGIFELWSDVYARWEGDLE